MHGFETTVPVTLEMMILQGHAVMRGSQRALVVVDMPFGSYEASKEQAFHSAARILKETLRRRQARGRRADGGDDRVPGRARRTCDGPYRPDAAIDQHARLVPRAGPRRGQLAADRERCTRRRGSRRLLGGDRGCRRAAREEDHREHVPSRPSASAPARPATARCWCWRTCSGCRRGRRNSCAATAISAPLSKPPLKVTPPTCVPAHFRGPSTSMR